jgi:hypothetical protein
MAAVLLARWASVRVRNHVGQTPAQLAETQQVRSLFGGGESGGVGQRVNQLGGGGGRKEDEEDNLEVLGARVSVMGLSANDDCVEVDKSAEGNFRSAAACGAELRSATYAPPLQMLQVRGSLKTLEMSDDGETEEAATPSYYGGALQVKSSLPVA